MNRRNFLLASTGCAVASNDARNAVVMVPKKYGMSQKMMDAPVWIVDLSTGKWRQESYGEWFYGVKS